MGKPHYTTAADSLRLLTIMDRIAQLSEAIGEPLDCEVGQRFIRLVITHGRDTQWPQRHVHAFVDHTNGDLIKSAGWKAPQKSKATGKFAVRFNLLDEDSFAECLRVADRNGGYLYVR